MNKYISALAACYFFFIHLHLLSASVLADEEEDYIIGISTSVGGGGINNSNEKYRHRILEHKKNQQEDASLALAATATATADDTIDAHLADSNTALYEGNDITQRSLASLFDNHITEEMKKLNEDDEEDEKKSKANKDRNHHPEKEYFEPGPDLDVFRNVDSSKFQWVNPSMINAGEVTCGYLKTPFGWPAGSKTGYRETDDQKQYPFARVYVCVNFAEEQPAPRGNIFLHCGGPNSLSWCASGTLSKLAYKYGYNIISMDQRGMGRSTPTFMIEECAYTTYTKYGILLEDLDASNDTSIREYAKLQKARNLGCWNYADFSVHVDDQDESSKRYHFLEYSGTRQLAEDIERTRQLFGGHKLSFYGGSYGTSVGATFATTFPSSINLMVLDSNMPPAYDAKQFAEDEARSSDMRINYFIASCDMGTNKHCGDIDMGSCISDIHKIFAAAAYRTFSDEPMYTYLLKIIRGMFGNYNLVSDICDAANKEEVERLIELFEKLLNPDGLEQPEEVPELIVTETASKSKSNPFGFSNDGTVTNENDSKEYLKFDKESIAMLVMSQDRGFGVYNEDEFVMFIQDIHKAYPGGGTQVPTKLAAKSYRYNYYWPNSTPLAPNGNPELTGIISGQMYDFATPYMWTQKMRENFPSAHLLTSRSINHVMLTSMNQGEDGTYASASYNDPACQAGIQQYLKNGYIDFVDGHVCESDPAGEACTINNILNSEPCKEVKQ